MSTADDQPISTAEAAALFAGLERARGLVLAVSGGPDSTALLRLVSHWRHARNKGPAILTVTVDHGLRPKARAEAVAVKHAAKSCGIAHRTMRWVGEKPKTGLQEAARQARYRLLAEAAARIHADYILTGHTSDDQAETFLMRMSRGSGLSGLSCMAREAPVPGDKDSGCVLLRPFLDIPKARLVATLRASGIDFADDPSNRNPRFTRVRLRGLLPALAEEGLSAARLGQLARRLRRADAAIAADASRWWESYAQVHAGGALVAFRRGIVAAPDEIRLRLLGRAIALCGNEGPVELGKLEALQDAVTAAVAAESRLRRTLAGAVVTVDRTGLTVTRAPARRQVTETRGDRPRDPLNHGMTLPSQSGQTALE